jgi:hypothetical protein
MRANTQNGDIALIACFASSWTPRYGAALAPDPFGFLCPWGAMPALIGSASPATPPSTGTVLTFLMGSYCGGCRTQIRPPEPCHSD